MPPWKVDYVTPMLMALQELGGKRSIDIAAYAPDLRGFQVIALLERNGVRTGKVLYDGDEGEVWLNVDNVKKAVRVLTGQAE